MKETPMRPSNRSRRGSFGAVATASILALSLSCASWIRAQEHDGAAGAGFLPQATVVEIMDSMVMPSAQVLWDAVSYESGPNGDVIVTPETDEAWQKLRWNAVTLAESANALLIPGREVNVAGAQSAAADQELSAPQIKALINKDHDAWIAHAHVLHEAAMQAIAAIDAKDGEQISEVGGAIDSACEGCHLQFWYPQQAQAR
jgi:hypothetical protein